MSLHFSRRPRPLQDDTSHVFLVLIQWRYFWDCLVINDDNILFICFHFLLDIGSNIQLLLAFVCISFQLINVYTELGQWAKSSNILKDLLPNLCIYFSQSTKLRNISHMFNFRF